MGKKQRHKKRSAPLIEVLEPRMLFSADFVGVVMDSNADVASSGAPGLSDWNAAEIADFDSTSLDPLIGGLASVTNPDFDPTSTEAASAVDLSNAVIIDDMEHGQTAEELQFSFSNTLDDEFLVHAPTALSNVDPGDARHELVFVDPSAPDYQQLLDDLLRQRDDGVLIEVFVLDGSQDGIDQITEILAGYQDLDAVHFVSHGTDGAVKLGDTWLGARNLDGYAHAIAGWRNALTAEADLLFYGCKLAASIDGQLLIESLSELTQADVAASNDDTGHVLLDGDWDLEYRTGEVETAVAFSTQLQQSWSAVLATPTITARETVDSDGNGQIDYIKITTSENLDDDFSGLTIGVSGYALDADTPYVTNIGGGGANDNVFYVKLVESGSPDTAATPIVTVMANTTLSDFGGSNNIASEGGTVEVRVSAGRDDAEEGLTASSVNLTSTDMELAHDVEDQTVGLRFLNMTIPQGATITNAYVEFKTDETGSGATNLNIYGQAADNPGTFTTSNDNISSRVKTTELVQWNNVPAWNSVGALHQTPDLSVVIQEIVDRGGWTDGNAMVIIVTGTGTRTAESYDGDAAGAALLHVEYSGGVAATDAAAPVLLSANGIDTGTAGLFNDSSDQLNLVFSEAIQAVPSEADSETNFILSGTDGDNFPTEVGGDTIVELATTTVANDTIRYTFSSGDTANVNPITPGSTTIDVNVAGFVANSIQDAAGNDLVDTSTGLPLTITSVNVAPTAADNTVVTLEDTDHTFTVPDFLFNDVNGDSLAKIQITELETVGNLRLNGFDVILGQEIDVADITAGNLKFVPLPDQSGTGYDSFEFRVHDGTEYSAPVSITTIMNATFDAAAEGFSYADDTFGTSNPGFADGTYDVAGGLSGGGLRIDLASAITGAPVSGGWSDTFNLAQDEMVTVSLQYRMIMSEMYESNEFGEVILEIDGTRYGADLNNSLVHRVGDGNGGAVDDTGWLYAEFDIALSAGNHTLTVGAYNNDSTAADEYVEAHFDDINVTVGTHYTMTVDIGAMNDAPTLAATANDPTFTEGGARVDLFNNLTIGTVEPGQSINQLILTVTNVTDGSDELLHLDGEDIALTHANIGTTAANSYGYSVGLAGGTATVTLTTTGTSVADAQTLVDGLAYQNSNANPAAANRVVTLTSIQDSGGTANGGVDTTALAVTSTVTIASHAPSPDLRLHYGQGGDAVPQMRDWDDNTGTWSAEAPTVSAGSTIKWTVNQLSPDGSEELVAVLSDSGAGTELDLQRWDGNSWTVDWTATGITSANSDMRAFDMVYEENSGEAMVVYSDNTSNPVYRVWDGNDWSAEQSVFATPPGTGAVLWVELESRPGTNEIALVYADGQSDLHSVIWNGASWTEGATETTHETSLQSLGYRAFDVAYENSGDLMVAWGRSTTVEFATMAAGTTTWNVGTGFDLFTGMVSLIDLAAEPGGDRIALMALDVDQGTERLGMSMWNGSGWQNSGEYDNVFPHVETDGFGEFWAGVGWVGTSGEAVVMYSDSDSGVINWGNWTSGSGWTIKPDVSVPGASFMRSVQIESFQDRNEMMSVFSDQNGALWAATYDGTAWTVTNAGAALESGLSDSKTVSFSFDLNANASPVAADDSSSVNEGNTLNVAAPGLLANDTDADFDTLTVFDNTLPGNGTVTVNADGSFDYTPDTDFYGADSFDYIVSDGNDGTVHYWKLDGNGTDSVGSSNGILTGTSTVTGHYGDALSFDGVGDRVVVPDFTYTDEFTMSLRFKLDDITGGSYQYLYSHGTLHAANSLNVYIGEIGTADAGILRTALRDSNDASDGSGLDVDINALVGDGQWHTYTLTVESGVGAKVHIDGTLANSNANGGDSIDPGTSLYLGAREDLAARFYGGRLDSVQIFARPLNASEVADLDTGGTARATVNITVNPVNDAPALAATAINPTFTEGGARVDLFNAVSIGTVEAGQTIDQLILTVTNITDGAAEILRLDGEDIALTDTNSGTTGAGSYGYSVSLSGSTATVTLTTTGTSVVDAQILVDGLGYENSSENPTVADRVVTLTSVKDSGGTANGGVDTTALALASTVSMIAVNDAPTVTATAAGPTFTEGGASVDLFSNVVISTVESGQLVEEATITITNVTDGADEFIVANGLDIALTDDNVGVGYSVSISGTTATLTLSSAGATEAQAEGTLDSLAYKNTSEDPTAANRVVTITGLKDSGGTANGGVDNATLAIASTVSMTAVNDAPTLTATAADPTFTEGGARVDLFTGVSVGTVESGQTIDQLILTVTNITDGTAEILRLDGEDITLTDTNSGTTGAGSYGYSVSLSGSTATVTLTTTGTSVVDAQTLVDGLGYENSSENPTVADRVVTLTRVKDSGGTADGGVDTTVLAIGSTVTITAVNDAPTASAGPDQALYEGAMVTLDASGSSDPENDARTYTWVQTGGTSVTLSDVNAEQPTFSAPDVSDPTALTFEVSVNDGEFTTTDTVDIIVNPTGLLSNWTFEGNGQTAIDVTGFGNDGVFGTTIGVEATDPTRTNDGEAGDVITLDGGDFISGIGNNPAGTFTISAWVKDTGGEAGGWQVIYNAGSEIWFGVDRNAAPALYLDIGSGNGGVSTAAGTWTRDTWHHIVGTWDGATAHIYMDGVDMALTINGSPSDPTATSAAVGAYSDLNSEYWNGSLVDVRVYDQAIDAAEVGLISIGVNDPPTLTATAVNPTFTEGGGNADLFTGVTINTIENGQTVEELKFTVTNVTDGIDEVMVIDGENINLTDTNSGTTAGNSYGYSVSLTGTTATVILTTTGTAVADAQSLVDGLAYTNTSDEPTTADRVVTLTSVKDSGGNAGTGDDTTAISVGSTVTMQAANDAPTLTATAVNPTFTEGGGNADLFGGVTIGTVESGETIEELKFTVTNITDGADEIIFIDGENITLTDTNSGTTASNSYGYSVSLTGTTATVTLNTAGTNVANAQALVDGLAYKNTHGNPTTSDRVVTLISVKDSGGTANGGVDTTAISIGSTVTVVSVNGAPTLTATAINPTFSEGAGSADLFTGVTIGTVESGQTVEELQFTVTNVTDGTDEMMVIDGENITLTDTNIGTTATNSYGYSVSLAGTTATVTLTTTGTTVANAQILVDGLAYRNGNDEPTIAARVVTLTSVKDSGGVGNGGVNTTALAIGSTVTLTTVNDAPSLTATAVNPTFTEGGGIADLFTGVTIGTVESGQTVEELQFTVTNVTDGTDEMIVIDGENITLTDTNSGTTTSNSYGYSVTLTGSTATVTLTTTGTSVTNAQTLLDGLAYQNSSENPTVANRVVTLTSVKDSGGTADGGVDTTALAIGSTVAMTEVNDAPTLTGTAVNPTVTEGGGIADLFTGVTIGTVEFGQTVEELQFTVSNVTDGTNEMILVDGENITLTDANSGTTASNGYGYSVSLTGSTATVTLTTTGTSIANAQTLVDGLGYDNSSENPTVANRVVTLTRLKDSGGTASGGIDTTPLAIASTVTMTAINDDPTVVKPMVDQNAIEDELFSFQFDDAVFGDVESGAALTYSATLQDDSRLPSWLTFNAASRTFTGTPGNSDVGTIAVKVTAHDNDGGAVSDTFSIAVINTDDVPSIGGADSGTVTEDLDAGADNLLRTDGTLTIADADKDESSFRAETIEGSYGRLTIDALGSWNYSVDNAQDAIQQLNTAESATDLLTVTTADGTTHEIRITINGAGDAAVIAGIVSGTVSADSTVSATGRLTISDTDSSDNPVAFLDESATRGDHGYGIFELTAGNWTYTLNDPQTDVQALDVGETLTDAHTFTASDGSQQTVTISINGAEDQAVIEGATSGNVSEDGTLTASGTLTISDVDTSDNPIGFADEVATAGDNGFGSFELSGGDWSYTLNNDLEEIQALDVGESLTDTHTFTASDASRVEVTITIAGTGDEAVIEGTVTGSVMEDQTMKAAGTLTISDADTPDVEIVFADELETPGDNGYGTFELSQGSWTYTLNNAHATLQLLNAGDTVTDTHTFTASDGSTQLVVVTIAGADSPPAVDEPAGTREAVVSNVVDTSAEDDTFVQEATTEEEPEVEEESTPAEPSPDTEEETADDNATAQGELTESVLPTEGEPLTAVEFLDQLAGNKVIQPPADVPQSTPMKVYRTQDVTADEARIVASKPIQPKFIDLQNLDIESFGLDNARTVETKSIARNQSFVDSMEELSRDLDEVVDEEEGQIQLRMQSIAVVTLSFSAGVVTWLLRAGSLFTSFMSMVPLWRQFDPLPILGVGDNKRPDERENQAGGDGNSDKADVEAIFEQKRSEQ